MKISKYNYIEHRNGLSYWYNGLNHTYFRISESLGRKLESVLETESFESLLPTEILNLLVDKGFIVDNDCDELAILYSYHEKSKESKHYQLVILPTLNCNLNCWYCIQDHIPSKMTDEVMDRLKSHIRYMIDKEKIESIDISWFGGEPFLYFDEVIRPINIYAQAYCKEKGVFFSSSATTNCTLVVKDIADQLSQLNIRNFQVTLDGVKDLHDSIKFEKNIDSAFDLTLNNLKYILETNPDFNLLLRINYTSETLNDNIVNEVNSYISPSVRKRVRVILKKVWQEGVQKDRYEVVSHIISSFRESGYDTRNMDLSFNYLPCYTNKKYYNAINYDGFVMKCTANEDPYLKEGRGILEVDGRIKWKHFFDKKYLEKTFDNGRCLNCKRLPICMGICSRDFLKEKEFCKQSCFDFDYNSIIVSYIDSCYSF
ncbi:MAG: radical SAM protein [Bacteroidales bacterium]|nr:radical SAM protein [Bacteroidales bacterium]